MYKQNGILKETVTHIWSHNLSIVGHIFHLFDNRNCSKVEFLSIGVLHHIVVFILELFLYLMYKKPFPTVLLDRDNLRTLARTEYGAVSRNLALQLNILLLVTLSSTPQRSIPTT